MHVRRAPIPVQRGGPEHKGVPKGDVGLQSRGRPVQWYPTHVIVETCGVLTKKGVACKARPVRGEGVCVGHRRMVGRGE